MNEGKTHPELPEAPRGLTWLVALNRKSEVMYEGTGSPYKVRKRRAKNKVAKRSRKVNRP